MVYRSSGNMIILHTNILLLVFCKSITVQSTISELVSFGKVSDDSVHFQNCVCVPFWQCKKDESGFIEENVDIADIRRRRSAHIESKCVDDWAVCCKVECGRKNNQLLSYLSESKNKTTRFRILGGNNDADFGEFPWMLGILRENIFLCGASLILPQVAITAAHCVSIPGRYTVRAGEWNFETREESLPHQERMSKKVILHPYYRSASLHNDIAILILEVPFTLSLNVGVVCLPSQRSIFTNARCIASGWGKNSALNGKYQSTLKKIDLPIVPPESCVRSLQRARLGPYFQLHQSFICAGEEDKDTCKGDGGSPLVCPIEDSDRYEQAGIVSWGLTCGLQNSPGVYVNVALFVDWIDQQMIIHKFDTTIYRK